MQCFHTGYSKTVLLFTGIQGARVCTENGVLTNLIHLHETGRLSEDHRIHGEELSQINKAAGAHLINEELRAASRCGYESGLHGSAL